MGEFHGEPIADARECPFCGLEGTAELRWRWVDSKTARFWVSCSNCHGSTGGYREKKDARNAWEGMA